MPARPTLRQLQVEPFFYAHAVRRTSVASVHLGDSHVTSHSVKPVESANSTGEADARDSYITHDLDKSE